MHDTGFIGDVLEAYERLILDAMRGDHTLFNTAEGIEATAVRAGLARPQQDGQLATFVPRPTR